MPMSRMQARRNAFAINIIHRSINMMLHYYKDNMCPPGYNEEKTINVVNWPEPVRKKKKKVSSD